MFRSDHSALLFSFVRGGKLNQNEVESKPKNNQSDINFFFVLTAEGNSSFAVGCKSGCYLGIHK